MKRADLLPAVAAGSLMVGLALVFFWKIIFTNLILVSIDSFLYFYPYRAYVTRALLDGQFPLWNPHLFLGAPLFANMQTAVLYPFHWLFLGLSVPKQVAASIVLHVALAGLGVLAYARRSLGLGWLGALAAGVIFGLGGYLGGQVGHINQLSGVAWLPWTFLLLDMAAGRQRRVVAALVLSAVIALMILAGHAQSVFICLVGLALYALVGGQVRQAAHDGGTPEEGPPAGEPGAVKRLRLNLDLIGLGLQRLKSRLPYLVALAVAVAVAVLLAAVQLVPTLELSALSVRSGGLSYREATSFSLNPWLLHFTLLPPFGVDLAQVFGEAYSEYVAYVGIIGLGLALYAVWRGWVRPAGEGRGLSASTRFFTLLAALGLFLALGRVNPFYYLLYKIVPGFDLFRAPARWMLLYTFGMSLLAGIGLQLLSGLRPPRPGRRDEPRAKLERTNGRRPRIASGVSVMLFVVLCVELFVASRGLGYNQPTAPEAFTFLRPSVAHLKTDPGLHRFLSLSGIVYDPGDLAEMRAILADQLPEKAIYDYVVAAKQKEVLFYNLPLLYGFYSVDGYDGGLLPLREFVTMQRLFLDEDQLSVDGRLREKLHDVPPGHLLSLLGVKYVITDKVYDVWIDGVFYDLQFSARLSPGGITHVETTQLPDFPTTALGVVSYLDGAQDVADGVPVARIAVMDDTGWSQGFDLWAGRDTSQGRFQVDVEHEQARVGHTWRDDPEGSDYITLIPLDSPRRLTSILVEGTTPAGEFVLRGLSLVDTRTATSRQLTLSTEGRYQLVHSGDVKIYENLEVLPRAFVVHQAEVSGDDEEAIARLRDPSFDPARTVILGRGEPLAGTGGGLAEIIHYGPARVVVNVTSDAPGYLVLADTIYPGWVATVDGEPSPIQRANLMFRAVQLEPGSHRVEFSYRPVSVRLGAGISALGLLVWVGGLVWSLWVGSRKKPGSRVG